MAGVNLVYSVPGVSCEHCRTAIAYEVGAVAGVQSVSVDLDEKVVSVSGRDVSDQAVRDAIAEAGYDIAKVTG
jgi:copper chaperone